MDLIRRNPFDLQPNSWNSNKVERANFDKLKKSLNALDAFKPIICRTLDDGTLEILGGFHRNEAAKELGWAEVPVLDLGNISEDKAREISIVDNRRYGEDDPELLEKLLDQISDLSILSDIVPDEPELVSPEVELPDMSEERMADTEKDELTKTLRFKLDTDKAEEIEALLANIAYDNGYKYADGYSNLSDALYHALILDK